MRLDEDKFYTVGEVAALFRLSISTIRMKLSSGELRGFKTSNAGRGEWRIKGSAVNAYIKQLEDAYAVHQG